jgi:lipid-A-disaccharide synthase
MRYYLLAGEASGDMHGAALIRAIRRRDPEAVIRVWGGDLMEAEGAELVKHYRDLAFMGFAEVVAHLGTIIRNLKMCKSDILAFEPDAVIFIDYPGFNLRIAKWTGRKGLRCFYYIAPQIWAWNSSRGNIIRKSVEQVYAILPFEQAFYKKFGMDVLFVGHPLKERIAAFEVDDAWAEAATAGGRPVLALLPGSRRQEIRTTLPVMLGASASLVGYRPIVAMAPAIEREFYEELLADFPGKNEVMLVRDRMYGLLSVASLAVVTSGTATLETALFRVPLVVVYKGSRLSFAIARRLVKVKYICLINLIMGREVVPELIQSQCTSERVSDELSALASGERREAMLADFGQLAQMLGPSGAADRVAGDIIERLGRPAKA